jgi:NitT/TauT family transport system permease protein
MGHQSAQEFRILPPLIAGTVLIVLWQAADMVFGFDKLILPNPFEVALALWKHFPRLAFHASITLLEAFSGFVLATILSLVLASLATFSRPLGSVLLPLSVAVKATPVIVLAPLLIMWLGNGFGSKVVMAAVASFFPILVNTYLGMTSVEAEWLSLMKLHKASSWQVFWHLRLPHALPDLFAGLRVATSLSMVGAVVSEFTGAEQGLGKLISTSTFYLNIDLVFAGVLILSLSGIAFYQLIAWLHRVLVFWETSR